MTSFRSASGGMGFLLSLGGVPGDTRSSCGFTSCRPCGTRTWKLGIGVQVKQEGRSRSDPARGWVVFSRQFDNVQGPNLVSWNASSELHLHDVGDDPEPPDEARHQYSARLGTTPQAVIVSQRRLPAARATKKPSSKIPQATKIPSTSLFSPAVRGTACCISRRRT